MSEYTAKELAIAYMATKEQKYSPKSYLQNLVRYEKEFEELLQDEEFMEKIGNPKKSVGFLSF